MIPQPNSGRKKEKKKGEKKGKQGEKTPFNDGSRSEFLFCASLLVPGVLGVVVRSCRCKNFYVSVEGYVLGYLGI